jgi:hypothetical protein
MAVSEAKLLISSVLSIIDIRSSKVWISAYVVHNRDLSANKFQRFFIIHVYHQLTLTHSLDNNFREYWYVRLVTKANYRVSSTNHNFVYHFWY